MEFCKIRWFLRTSITKFLYGKIGEKTYIGPTSLVQNRKKLFLGNNVHIYPGMRADTVLDDAEIHIGDNCSIAQNFHIVSYSGILNIGADTTVSANVFISNVNHEYSKIDQHILKQNMLYSHTAIGENCFIGYGTVIMPGTVLGRQCIVGANSVVKGVYPDYCVIAGVPARIIRRYNFQTEEWEKV